MRIAELHSIDSVVILTMLTRSSGRILLVQSPVISMLARERPVVRPSFCTARAEFYTIWYRNDTAQLTVLPEIGVTTDTLSLFLKPLCLEMLCYLEHSSSTRPVSRHCTVEYRIILHTRPFFYYLYYLYSYLTATSYQTLRKMENILESWMTAS